MKKGWQTKKLGEVCSFLNRGVSPKYVEKGGIAVLNQRCVRDHVVSFEVGRRHDVKAKSVSNERLLQAGDVLVNSTGTGTLGRVAQLREDPPEPTTVDSHVTIVRPSPGQFFPEFFGYVLRDIEDELKQSGEGCGGQTELNRSVLAEKFEVRFPHSLAEQQRIVGLLDEAFEGLATATANAEKNLQNARALFESYLQSVFTQRGPGWVEKSVGELVADGILVKPFDGNHGEIHPKKSDYTESGVPFIMARDLQDGLVDTEHCIFISRKLADSLRVGFAKDGDVLISHKGTIGRSAIVSTEDDYIMLTPQVTGYRVKDSSKLFNRFIRYFFMSPGFQREMIAGAADGSTRAYIGITKQLTLRFRFPSLADQKRIAAKLDDLDPETQRLARLYERKHAALEALKKSLLHQAFTGEL
jgi:type I restriction enzyme S subunit